MTLKIDLGGKCHESSFSLLCLPSMVRSSWPKKEGELCTYLKKPALMVEEVMVGLDTKQLI